MVFESLRRWGRDRVPLPHPDIAEVRIRGVLDDLGGARQARQVSSPMIRAPETTHDLLRLASIIHSDDLSLADRQPETLPLVFPKLDEPTIHNPPFPPLWLHPKILDVFAHLDDPGWKGKAYGDKDEGTAPMSPVSFRPKKCKHGLYIDECGLCTETPVAGPPRTGHTGRGHRRLHTADVFDLLLPFLQPPIEVLLAEPLLFPPNRRPYDFQIAGIRFLAERETALLGDEMGLGKTIQTIVALQVLFRKGDIRTVLVLCPRSLLGTWAREIGKWAPELFVLKVRGNRKDREWWWRSKASVYLTTYETLREDLGRDLPLTHRFDLVVLDEIQKIKNPSARLTRAARGYRRNTDGGSPAHHSRIGWRMSSPSMGICALRYLGETLPHTPPAR